ncbi:hypothetical protein [Actinomadura madurae]|nr:hypothetical protein [Actinomadura madurae]MCP9977112.1 hypothetical protein [Actinomadura madurae]
MSVDARPWLARYGEGIPAGIEPEYASALDMAAVTAAAHPDADAILDEIPKTVTGKLLRRALRDRPAGPAGGASRGRRWSGGPGAGRR